MAARGKRKRTHNLARIKRNITYSLPDVADLLGTHKNTVGLWMKQGLPRIDDTRPYLIHGSDLKAFLATKQQSRKRRCKKEEFYCCRCRQPRPVWENIVDITFQSARRFMVSGLCAVCSARMNKAASVKSLPEIQKTFVIQKTHNSHLVETADSGVNCDFKKGE